MMRIRHIDVRPYNIRTTGLLKAKRLRPRVRFYIKMRGQRQPKHFNPPGAETLLRPFLTTVYDKIARSPYAPMSWPDRIRAVWTKEKYFVLQALGFNGFYVSVTVEDFKEKDESPEIIQGSVRDIHGADLPRFGT